MIVVSNEGRRQVHSIVDNEHHFGQLTYIEDHVHTALSGKRLKCGTDILVDRFSRFPQPFLVSALSILSLSLDIFLECLCLLNLRVPCRWSFHGLGRIDVLAQLLILSPQFLKVFAGLLEFAGYKFEGADKLGDPGLGIGKSLGIDDRDFAVRNYTRGLRGCSTRSSGL